jgi:hypothetical protein
VLPGNSELKSAMLDESGEYLYRLSTRLATLAVGWLFMGCTAAGPDDPPLLSTTERGPALLVFYGDTTAVELAASVRVGEVAIVRFTSFGGGCIRQDRTEAAVSGLTAEVRGYRREPRELPPNTACTLELRTDHNVAELRFAEPGLAHVRIVGLARPGDRPFVLERDLLVTP